MNKNKGVIGIGLILAIVLGIVVVGGGAYYLGKSGSKQEVNNPIVNQKQEVPVVENNQPVNVANPTNPVVSTGCTSSSIPSITVLSPNGGEAYKAGDKITVKWESCNIESKVSMALALDEDRDKDVKYTEYNAGHSNDYFGFTLGGYSSANYTENDGIQEITIPKSDPKLVFGEYYYFSISAAWADLDNYNYNTIPGSKTNDISDSWFTINSETTTAKLKTYTNKEYGIEFQYPSTLTVAENQWPARSGSYDSGYSIAVSVPFKTHYDAWTSKGIDITIHKSSCSDYLPTSPTQKKIINGISYSFQDPEWGATSGMSSISKWRKYFYESADKCYTIEERLSGLGNNERPSTYTFPSDVDKFLDEEMLDLDKIMASVKIY